MTHTHHTLQLTHTVHKSQRKTLTFNFRNKLNCVFFFICTRRFFFLCLFIQLYGWEIERSHFYVYIILWLRHFDFTKKENEYYKIYQWWKQFFFQGSQMGPCFQMGEIPTLPFFPEERTEPKVHFKDSCLLPLFNCEWRRLPCPLRNCNY